MSISVRVGRESSLAEAAAKAAGAAGANLHAEQEPDDSEAELIREARALMAAGRLQ